MLNFIIGTEPTLNQFILLNSLGVFLDFFFCKKNSKVIVTNNLDTNFQKSESREKENNSQREYMTYILDNQKNNDN